MIKKNVHLILTIDYEVFGNGGGCIDRCVIDPADRMMLIADRFKAPITFFVETTEFLAMQDKAMAVVDRVQQQLSRSISRGHDAQLHIHPQWNNATRKANGSWQVDDGQWRIGDLPLADTLQLLKAGKAWLDRVMSEGNPGKHCLAFRAGSWCIQPSESVVEALLEIGFQIDSTVAPGFHNMAFGEWSDFRNVPRRPFWKTDGNVCCETSSGLWEVPIVTGKIGKWQHAQVVKTARAAGENGMAPDCFGDYQGPGGRFQRLGEVFGKVRRLGNVMLDLATMPTDVLIEVTKQWIHRFHESDAPIPVVAIGHTKNFTPSSEENLTGYLEWVKSEEITFSTYGRWLEAIHE